MRDMGGMTYRDVQELPTDVYALWQAFRQGENDTRREAAAKQRDRTVVVG